MRGNLLAASTLRCQGDYRSAAVGTVLIAGRLKGRADSLAAGVLVPEDAVTIADLRPGLAEAHITVVDEPVDQATDGGSALRQGSHLVVPRVVRDLGQAEQFQQRR